MEDVTDVEEAPEQTRRSQDGRYFDGCGDLRGLFSGWLDVGAASVIERRGKGKRE